METAPPPKLGAIEAGGTTFVCGVGPAASDFRTSDFRTSDLRTTEIATTSPAETLERVAAWFRAAAPEGLGAVGIASFGPVDPNPASPNWGYITSTPKALWRNFDFAGAVRSALGAPVAFDTDVNAALIGERRWGAAQDADNCIYLTVGTGIGGAALVAGSVLNGASHTEMGHIRVPRDPADRFEGACPFHADCLEGLASGPAIAARWGSSPEDLPSAHPAWRLEAGYLACALASYTCILAPERIVLGGGVMRQSALLPMIGARLAELLAGYLPAPEVVPAGLGANSGVLGAFELARRLRNAYSPRITGVPR